MATTTHSTQPTRSWSERLLDTVHVHPRIIGFSAALIIVIGLIHFVDAPDDFTDSTYKGILFLLNGFGGLAAAYGIYRGSKLWGWILGLLVAGGAFIGYIISRTIGLPLLGVETDWFEPLGVLAMITEGMYLLISLAALTNRLSDKQHKAK